MVERTLLLVCEGETDIYVFQALSKHYSNTNIELKIILLAPQQDATSGTYPSFGYGSVLNWCESNKNKINLLIDFQGASALLLQMDTDIAMQVNSSCMLQNKSARQCCEEKINQKFDTTKEPEKCHYILPTESTETWLLASYTNFSALNNSCKLLVNFEHVADTVDLLIDLGFPRKGRKLRKTPAKSYIKHSKQLVDNIVIAKSRCDELDRLCQLLDNYAQ